MRLIILFFTFLHHSSSFGQPFLGEWSGEFANNKMSVVKPFAAKLLFKKDLNGKLESYSISYYKTKESIDSIICKLNFLTNNGDRYFFREAEILNSNSSFIDGHCFQIIHFIIGKRKKENYLHCRFTEDIEGNEDDEEGKCTYGFLNLYKHKE